MDLKTQRTDKAPLSTPTKSPLHPPHLIPTEKKVSRQIEKGVVAKFNGYAPL